jgi:hypothetical protein
MKLRFLLPPALAALVLAAFLLRPKTEPAPSIAPERGSASEGQPSPPPVSPPPAPPLTGGRPTSADPLLRRWQTAIAQRDANGVTGAQSLLLEREGEYREPLVRMAKEDPDARVRAFTIKVLSRMKAPPPESFFLDHLGDPHVYPRKSALEVLEKIGTPASLASIERAAAGDASEEVRAAAAQAAKAVRSR